MSSGKSVYAQAERFSKPAGAMLIAVAAFIVYLPSLHGTVLLDDDHLLSESPVIRAPDGLYRIWFTTQAPDYWPLTNSMFWLEWRLWGHDVHYPHQLSPLGYHCLSLALHIASALLIWKILDELAIPGAFLAALLFTIHPVNVESVAWMSQQKNTLSMVFFLLSILWYLQSDDRWQSAVDGWGSWNRWYWLSLTAFVLSLLSKGSVAILPVLLLGLVWWRRKIKTDDLLRLAPFLIVAAVFTGVNIWFQAHANIVAIRQASIVERLLGAGAIVWFYLYKALWPLDLAFVYPQWHINAHNILWWLPLIATAMVSLLLWWKRSTRFGRPLLFAWGFFCVALLPVMGLTDVGFMRFSLVADHYQYIAIISVMALLAAIIWQWRGQATGIARSLATSAAVLLTAGFAFLAWQQSDQYRDAITLYRAALEKNPDCWMLHGNLGDALYEAGELKAAIPEMREAIRINPESDDAHFYLARALAKLGDTQQAIEHYEKVLQIRPNYEEALNELANYYARLGRISDALATADKALGYARSAGNDDLVQQIEAWKASQLKHNRPATDDQRPQ